MNPDYLDQMLCFELGTLDQDQVIQLFQGLIDTGVVWQLQGFYVEPLVTSLVQALSLIHI